jgi:hypothetical protein
MMVSFKNRLQEIYQKIGLPLPEYNTVTTNDGYFISNVSIIHNGKLEGYTGNKEASKTKAEMSAAELAYNTIKGTIKLSAHNIPVEYEGPSVVLVIDLENKQKALEELSQKYMLPTPDIRVVAFVTKDHGSIPKIKYPVEFKIIKCKLRDAVDLAITMWLGRQLVIDSSPTYIIWTGDKFGETVSQIVGEGFMIGNVKCISSIDEL